MRMRRDVYRKARIMKNKVKEIGSERGDISNVRRRTEKEENRGEDSAQEMSPRLKICRKRAKINSAYIQISPTEEIRSIMTKLIE